MNLRILTLSLVSLSLVACRAADSADHRSLQGSAERPTEPFRQEHVEIQEHLQHVRDAVGELHAGGAGAPERMRTVVTFFTEHIGPHARAEERSLYPAVDRRMGGAAPFTSSMRHDHRIVERWIAELEAHAAAAEPDAVAFARRTDELLGLLAAHFEKEEEVLLPILDRSMSAEEFRREVLEPARGH